MPERSCYPEYQIADPRRQARRLAAATASGPTTASTVGSPESTMAMRRTPGDRSGRCRETVGRAPVHSGGGAPQLIGYLNCGVATPPSGLS
jgi:hypothetical protein